MAGYGGGREGETEGGAGGEAIINKELSADVVSGGGAGVIIGGIDRAKEDTIELVDVSDDSIGTLIFNPVRAIR